MKARITAPIEEQWSPVGSVAPYDTAYYDGVIAARVLGLALTLDMSQGAVEQDQTFGAQVVTNPLEPILVLVGKAPSQCFLVTAQNVDHEFIHSEDYRMNLRLPIHAHRNQRRGKRDRSQAIRRHAERPPVRPYDGQHRDTGGKVPE